MSEEQKDLFYNIIKDAYKQGVESDKVTVASLLEEMTQKLEILIDKRNLTDK
jgi:replicative DNA helicase